MTKEFLRNLIVIFPIIIVMLALLFFKFQVISVFDNQASGKIILIIDDFGNGGEATTEFINSDIPFAAAVMPNGERTFQDSVALYEAGKDILLHMPMEAHNGKPEWLGKVYISDIQTDEEIKNALSDSLSQIYGAIGINNHMGSKATESERVSHHVVELAKNNNLLVIDSKTSANSAFLKVSKGSGVKVYERDIFLDGSEKGIEVTKKKLREAAKIAKKQGSCIAIGHVGEAGGLSTYKAIISMQEELSNMNVEFVALRQIAQDNSIE